MNESATPMPSPDRTMRLDPRMPPAQDCVLRSLIDRRAAEAPQQVVGLFQDGSSMTHAQLRDEVRACAAGLQALGVRQGDYVLSWLPNGRQPVVLMFALAYLGAVYSPINTAYRWGLLAHVIRNSGARLLVADGALVERLRDLLDPRMRGDDGEADVGEGARGPGPRRSDGEGSLGPGLRRSDGEGALGPGVRRDDGSGAFPALDPSLHEAAKQPGHSGAGRNPGGFALTTVVVTGPTPPDPIDGLTFHDATALTGDPGTLLDPPRAIAPWDTFAVIYTSGTTGPSKGVLVSCLQVHQNYLSNGQWLPEDRALIALPMFHMAGAGLLASTLMRGGSFALIDSFRTQDFWADVRRFQATNTTLLGVMTAFLLKAPPAPDDRDHTLKRAMCVPLSDQHPEFTRRFGTQIFTAWNMTETSSPIFAGPAPDAPGTCGRPRAGVDVRIVDANDCEVPVGEVGELLVRTDMPYAMSHGYLHDAEATAKAWRNGWFHTGDGFRRDAQGWFYFVDRMKDAIRRRGENISSFEVEKELLAHPAVRDAAVVAVPSEHSEDEVLAVVCPVPGRGIDCAELIRFLQPRLARFMIPRYLRVLDDLPRTPTNKVQKHLLRAEGLAAGTWDRDAAGIVLEKDPIRRRA